MRLQLCLSCPFSLTAWTNELKWSMFELQRDTSTAGEARGFVQKCRAGLEYQNVCVNTLINHTSLTSFIVLAVGTKSFHGNMTASPSPSWLADAVPPAGFQSAPPVVVAETWTTLWTKRTQTAGLETVELRDSEGQGHAKPTLCGVGISWQKVLKLGDIHFLLERWHLFILFKNLDKICLYFHSPQWD